MNAIEVKHISKKYTITPEFGRRIALRRMLSDIFHFKKKSKHTISALKDISFSIKQGDTVGIIGANGSGKSTLLRTIAGITSPTSGQITTYGKTAPLLSLGLGFHLELTGRENIYLNAAILGYAKKEVEKEIPSIIAFSELEKFIDTPVKFYSSGMYTRLAFSIATARNLEPDILLVDESLSVGDKVFKKKSFERMRELTKNTKTTILFVSHDLASIKKLCQTCIWLENGEIKAIGDTEMILKIYLK